jgi:hypothetical protein
VSAVLQCRTACKWEQLKLIVEHLGGDVEAFRRLWMATQTSTHDRTDTMTATELPRKEPQNAEGQIKFRQFLPADLGRNCILPQALDDQWVPRGQLLMMQADGESLTDLGESRYNVVRREYVRSLITAERIVVNRSFLFR